MTTLAVAAVAVADFAGQGAPDYRAIVHEYQTRPNTAVERILAMPQPDVVRAVRDAVRDTGRFTPADYAAALVMHGDVAIYFVQQRDPRAGSRSTCRRTRERDGAGARPRVARAPRSAGSRRR